MDPETRQPSFLQKYKLTLISLFIVLAAAIPLLLLSNSASKKPAATNTAMTSPTVSPTVAPMTAQNAEPTLTQVDSSMQATLNQMDTDVQSVNKIDGSQDSTTGL